MLPEQTISASERAPRKVAALPAELPAMRPITRLRTASITGLGRALPERRISSGELGKRWGIDAAWIEKRTGISERRYAEAGEGVRELAVRAGGSALEDAGLDPEQVDLLLVATVASDDITPGAAPGVAQDLGVTHGGAFDIGAACTGSMAGLALGSAWIECGRARNVLVIAAEVLSRFINFEDRKSAPLFGDGAGAFVLSADGPGRIGPFVFGSDGSRSSVIQVSRERGVLEMEGHETFLQAVSRLSACSLEVAEMAGVTLDEIDLFVYHQANSRILTALAERLELPAEKVFDCIAELGNTSAASLPVALTKAREAGLIEPGSRLLLGAIGAGLGWGTTVVEWGDR